MAGIGFTLERMARGGSLTSVVGAYGHAVMVVAGPWIFTLIGLAGTSFVACDAGCRDVQVFRSIIIYNSVFALIASSPIVFVSTRFIADRIFMKRFESVMFTLAASLGVYFFVALIFAAPFYGLATTLSLPETIASVQNLMLLGASWLMIPFLGTMRSANGIVGAFVLGAAAMILAAISVPDARPFYLLQSFNVGLALINGVLLWLLTKQCGGRIVADPALLTCARKYWELPMIGLTYGLGVWSDKIIMWMFAPEEKMRVAGAIVTMPLYDTPMFLAQLAALPVAAAFFIHAETEVLRLYRRLFDGIEGRASLKELKASSAALSQFIGSVTIFLFESLAAIALLGVLISFVAVDTFNLQPNQTGILRNALFAMAFNTSAMFCVILLLYLDLRRVALLITTTYLLLNIALTAFFLPHGFRFYAYGAFLASIVEFAMAILFLRRELPWLLFHVFVTNNVSRALR